MRRTVLTLGAALGLTGCPERSPEQGTLHLDAGPAPGVAAPDAEVSGPAASVAPRPREPVPDPITHPCVVTSAQFDIAFRDGDRSCRSDAECECIPLRVGERQACGGVTSRKTGAKLRALETEFTKLGCKSMHKCAARPCQPRCVSGQCE